MRFLALGHAPHFELCEPSVVGQELGDVLDHLHGTGERVFLLESEVVFAGKLIELLAQYIRRIGAHTLLFGNLRESDGVAPFLP